MEIDKDLLMWGLGLIAAAVATSVRNHAKTLESLEKDISDWKLRIIEHYVKKDDLKETIQPIFRKLDKIESMISNSSHNDGNGFGDK
jgi:chromosome segregation ATPase